MLRSDIQQRRRVSRRDRRGVLTKTHFGFVAAASSPGFTTNDDTYGVFGASPGGKSAGIICPAGPSDLINA